MTKNFLLPAGLVVLAALAGCESDDSGYRTGSRHHAMGQTQASVVLEDDYDYYPDYEIYYSRNRHEYVYRDGNAWVRRPQPRGVTVDFLFSTPSVRMDFRDAPERHHAAIIKTYPRNWHRPEDRRDDRRDQKDEQARDKDKKKDDRRADERSDNDRKN